MAMWTEQRCMDLIVMWENYPCLFDTSSADYVNRDKAKNAFIEIARALGNGITGRNFIFLLRCLCTGHWFCDLANSRKHDLRCVLLILVMAHHEINKCNDISYQKFWELCHRNIRKKFSRIATSSRNILHNIRLAAFIIFCFPVFRRRSEAENVLTSQFIFTAVICIQCTL